MRTVRFLALSALLIFTQWHCTSKSAEPVIVENDDYPSVVGSRFVYEVRTGGAYPEPPDTSEWVICDSWVDSSGARIVFFALSADDSGKIGSYRARFSEDTVDIFHGLNPTAMPNFRYLFPLQIGTCWELPATGDSVYVTERDIVRTPAGEFRKAFRLYYRVVTFIDVLHFEYWYVPGYGNVQERVWTDMEGPLSAGVVTLIDYSIPE
jgi:hypothetical protein